MLNLYPSLFVALSGSAAVAFLLQMVVLRHGELCAGQRARVQGQFTTITSCATLGALCAFEAGQAFWQTGLLIVAAVMGWGMSWKLSKLRIKQSLDQNWWWLLGAPLCLNALAVVVANPFLLFAFALSGASLGHWLLVKAKHRLSAFDKILPFAGILFGMLSMSSAALALWLGADRAAMAEYQQGFMIFAVLLLSSVLLWLLPMFRDIKPAASALVVVMLGTLASTVQLQNLLS
ncbi:hypothetical protein [Aliagarivorans taiwanensis]|uniref:hypothetical protein n=1 Tax=Aliagarivorans taiwanensis TaxID=561966 RepID=UPI0004166991|nr:hypothetical protein [Aliagarivorans taiwanensis]